MSNFIAMKFPEQLQGGDLRALGNSNEVVKSIGDQHSFNELFQCIFNSDRIVAMRSIDAIEKISLSHPEYLKEHKSELLGLLNQSRNKEFKWHLPQLISRLPLSIDEAGHVWETLTRWALDPRESRIVRVNSLQALFDLLKLYPDLKADFSLTVAELQKTEIPSIKARLKQFKSVQTG